MVDGDAGRCRVAQSSGNYLSMLLTMPQVDQPVTKVDMA